MVNMQNTIKKNKTGNHTVIIRRIACLLLALALTITGLPMGGVMEARAESATNGGGGAPVIPKDPEEPVTPTEPISTTTKTDTADVPLTDLKEAVEKKTNGGMEVTYKDAIVTFDAASVESIVTQAQQISKTTKTHATTISVSTLKKAVKNQTNGGMKIKFKDATVTFNAAAVESIAKQAKGDKIQVVYRTNPMSRLHSGQKKTLKSKNVIGCYQVYVKSNGKYIKTFGGGKVTVKVPLKLKSGQKSSKVKFYYLSTKGKLEKMTATYKSGSLTFKTTHFSIFVALYPKQTATNTGDKTTDKDTDKTTDKDSGKDTDKDGGKDTDKDTDKDTGKDTDKDADKDSGKDTDKNADKDAGKDTDKDADKDTGKDTDKDSGKDTDKDSGKDSGSDKDSGGSGSGSGSDKDSGNSGGSGSSGSGSDSGSDSGKDTESGSNTGTTDKPKPSTEDKEPDPELISYDDIRGLDELQTNKSGEVIETDDYRTLQLMLTRCDSSTVRFSWNQVSKADGYDLYYARGNSSGTSFRVENSTKLDSPELTAWMYNNLKKNTYYKFVLRAYRMENKKPVYFARSKAVYVYTGDTFLTDVTVNSAKVELSAGETYNLKPATSTDGNKVTTPYCIACESSDEEVATVTNKGVITAMKSGTCYVYVFTQNGLGVRVKVTVK